MRITREHQALRSASTTFIRAARTARKNPPMKHMNSARKLASSKISGVTRNSNAVSENETQFVVPVFNPLKIIDSAQPIIAPSVEISSDSRMKAIQIDTGVK